MVHKTDEGVNFLIDKTKKVFVLIYFKKRFSIMKIMNKIGRLIPIIKELLIQIPMILNLNMKMMLKLKKLKSI